MSMRRVGLDVGHSSESASKRAKLEPGSHEGCSLGLDYASDEDVGTSEGKVKPSS